MKAVCRQCNFEDEFEPDELGINYYQAVGECPICGEPTFYENGEPTKLIVIFNVTESPNAERILITKIIEASGGDYNSIEDEILKVHNDPAHNIVLSAMEEYATLKNDSLINRLNVLESVLNLMKVPTDEGESEKFYEALEYYNALKN